MVNLISCKCPECKAELSIEEGREMAFCTYCGAKVIIRNDNFVVHKNINEAEIKRAENDYAIRMRQMDREDRERNIKKVIILVWIGIIILLILLSVIGALIDNESLEMCIAYALFIGVFGIVGDVFHFQHHKDEKVYQAGKVKITSSICNYEGKDYHAIESELKALGFTNIKVIPLNDLTTGIFKKPNQMDSLTIDGDDNLSDEEWYMPDIPIIITYHSFSNR